MPLDKIMPWENSVFEVRFLRRYKRFFADVEMDGGQEVAHVANTGSLKSVLVEGCPALVMKAANPERKLKWTLVALSPTGNGWVGIDTAKPNQLVRHVVKENLHPIWQHKGVFKPEVKLSKETRLDGVFEDAKSGSKHYIEVKNVTWAEPKAGSKGSVALFPDAVTERGQKHLREMMELVGPHTSCELVFVVQRTDCIQFQPAVSMDPTYAQLLSEAVKAGVQVSVWQVQVDAQGLRVQNFNLPIKIDG